MANTLTQIAENQTFTALCSNPDCILYTIFHDKPSAMCAAAICAVATSMSCHSFDFHFKMWMAIQVLYRCLWKMPQRVRELLHWPPRKELTGAWNLSPGMFWFSRYKYIQIWIIPVLVGKEVLDKFPLATCREKVSHRSLLMDFHHQKTEDCSATVWTNPFRSHDTKLNYIASEL